jgi:hypothetical protein
MEGAMTEPPAVTEHKNDFFGRDEYGRTRVRRDGATPQGEAWYRVEWKPPVEDAVWLWHMCGTATWLNLTAQEIEWAEANGKRKGQAP